MQTAKALLVETPRAWQAGFAIVPLKTEHSDDIISTRRSGCIRTFTGPSRSRIRLGLWA